MQEQPLRALAPIHEGRFGELMFLQKILFRFESYDILNGFKYFSPWKFRAGSPPFFCAAFNKFQTTNH